MKVQQNKWCDLNIHISIYIMHCILQLSVKLYQHNFYLGCSQIVKDKSKVRYNYMHINGNLLCRHENTK